MSQGAAMPKYHALQPVIAVALTCLLAGCNDDAPPPNTNDNEPSTPGTMGTASLPEIDRRILQTVHEKNLEEIAVGRMAMDKGTSEAVRAYADRLVKDHTKNEDDLRALTSELGVLLSEPAKQSPALQALEPLRGAEFDARFMTLMHEGHSTLVQEVETALSQALDGQVKSYLSKTLPVLEQHLQTAEEHAGTRGHASGEAAHNPQEPAGGR